MGGMGTVGAVRDVEAVGEVGEGSFLANDFFSFARLFWNHTFSHKVGEECLSGLEEEEMGWETRT